MAAPSSVKSLRINHPYFGAIPLSFRFHLQAKLKYPKPLSFVTLTPGKNNDNPGAKPKSFNSNQISDSFLINSFFLHLKQKLKPC